MNAFIVYGMTKGDIGQGEAESHKMYVRGVTVQQLLYFYLQCKFNLRLGTKRS